VNAEHWQRLRAAYDAVLDAPASKRQEILDGFSTTQPDIHEDLVKLLASEASTQGFLDRPIARIAPAPFADGDVLCGRFELIRRIGEGGMGEVWAARDRQLNDTEVALKTIRSSWVDAKSHLARFKREILLARQVAHPNVCRVHEFFEDPSVSPPRYFLVMELLPGETLASRLKRGAIPVRETIPIILDIAAGLAAAHGAGVVHRDLKPANVMLVPFSGSTRAVVMDFGLARAEARAGESFGTTVAGVLMGTPDYMAPEQIAGTDTSPATDVYGLGLILFEMLRGVPPFAGVSTAESWMRRAREGPAPLNGLVPGVSSHIDDVIAQCLQYEPAKRFRSATAFREALASDGRLALNVTRRQIVWAAAAVALLIAAWSGMAAWSRLSRPQALPQEAARWYNDAQHALAEGASVRALNDITRAIALAPRAAPLHVAMAEISLELDMPARASESMLRADELARDGRLSDDDSEYWKGVHALLLRQCDQAIAALSQRASLVPAEERPYRMVAAARAMERCDRPDEAMKEMAEAARIDPRNAAVPLRSARLAARQRAWASADESLDRAERLFRDRNNAEGVGEVLTLRGTLLAEQNRLDEASAALEKATEIAKSLDDVRQQIRIAIQKAIVSRKRGDVATAGSLTNDAIALGRQHGLDTLTLEGLMASGNVHMVRNEFPEAAALFERALSIAEANRHEEHRARALLSLGSVYFRTTEPERALKAIQSGKEFYERINHRRIVASATMLLGQVRVMRAEYDEAVRIFEALLQEVLSTKDPEQEATVRENLATALAAGGNYPRALEEYRAALTLHRRSTRARSQVYALLNVSETLSRLGRFDEADRAFAEAKGLGSATPEISVQMLRVQAAGELRRGRYLEAAALARKVMGPGPPQSVERFLRASLIACAAEASLGRYRDAAAVCDDAVMRSASRGHLELLREGRLVTAEMYVRSGDRAAAERVLRESAGAGEKSVSQEERCRYLALSAAVGDSGTKTRVHEQLTRELAGLRMNWGEGNYQRWSARADIRGVLALATLRTS
jgi:tetratricopeptide (TPR) repeat protein